MRKIQCNQEDKMGNVINNETLSSQAVSFLEMMLNTYGEVANERPMKVSELDKGTVQDIVMDGLRMHEIFPEDVDLEVVHEVMVAYGLVDNLVA